MVKGEVKRKMKTKVEKTEMKPEQAKDKQKTLSVNTKPVKKHRRHRRHLMTGDGLQVLRYPPSCRMGRVRGVKACATSAWSVKLGMAAATYACCHR